MKRRSKLIFLLLAIWLLSACAPEPAVTPDPVTTATVAAPAVAPTPTETPTTVPSPTATSEPAITCPVRFLAIAQEGLGVVLNQEYQVRYWPVAPGDKTAWEQDLGRAWNEFIPLLAPYSGVTYVGYANTPEVNANTCSAKEALILYVIPPPPATPQPPASQPQQNSPDWKQWCQLNPNDPSCRLLYPNQPFIPNPGIPQPWNPLDPIYNP